MTTDVIGYALVDDISTLSPASKSPKRQKLSFQQGVSLTVRMYVKTNGDRPLDITNWSFEMSIRLEQRPSPNIAGPPPPVTLKRQGVITETAGPYGGVVEFYFQESETSEWYPNEGEDAYDIYGTSPPTLVYPLGESFCLVPPSNMTIGEAVTEFTEPATPTPNPPWPYVQLANFPVNALPDPGTYPINTTIVGVDTLNGTYSLLYNPLGTSWETIAGGGGGGGNLPPFSGIDGAAVVEDGNPSPTASFRRLTMDDIDPAFTADLVAAFGLTVEVGSTIINPTFSAAYNAAVASATLTDEVDTRAIPSPFTAFGYNTTFPARSYVKTVINATSTWTLAATKAGGDPIVRNDTVVAAWRPRVRYQERVPAAIDETFILTLTGSALASGLARTIAYGAGGGTKKLYYAIPTAFGNPSSFKDEATLISVPFTKVAASVSVTNSFGVTLPYDVWASDNFLINALSVVVV